jgi:hypothetical protein
MKWVSVGDELPREGRTAVMVSNGHTVAPAWWVDGGFSAFCDRNLPLRWVTHWSRFPGPPGHY